MWVMWSDRNEVGLVVSVWVLPFTSIFKCHWIEARLLWTHLLLPSVVRGSRSYRSSRRPEQKLEDTVAVCVYFARGWRLREGGGVVGNRSILQMLQGRRRRREWKVLRLSVVRHSLSDSQRYSTCGPVPIPASLSHFLSDEVIVDKF